MKIKHYCTIISLICALFIFQSCNESGNFWTKYSNESFSATVRYEQSDTDVCAKIKVIREGEQDSVRVEFASPDTLRGAVGIFEQNEFSLTCANITLTGDAAKAILDIPVLFAVRDAVSFEKLTEGDQRLLAAHTEHGKIIFDPETEKPIRAEICGTVCNIVTFSWQ